MLDLAVGVGATLLAGTGHHVDEAAVVLNAALGTASLLLLLVLLGHLGCLATHLTWSNRCSALASASAGSFAEQAQQSVGGAQMNICWM